MLEEILMAEEINRLAELYIYGHLAEPDSEEIKFIWANRKYLDPDLRMKFELFFWEVIQYESEKRLLQLEEHIEDPDCY